MNPVAVYQAELKPRCAKHSWVQIPLHAKKTFLKQPSGCLKRV